MTKEKKEYIKREILGFGSFPEKQAASIIYDGKQYTIRIPKKLAEASQLDPDKDIFVFNILPPESEDELPGLEGELVGREEYEKERKKSSKH